MPKTLQAYNDFRGGWNADAAPDNLADNELALADNVDLSERGGLSKRKGTVRLNAASYGAQVEQVFEWPRNNGEVWLMAVVGQTLCRIATNGTKTALQALAGPRVAYFFLQDKLYFLDGAQIRVYDGSTVAAVTASTDPENSYAPIRRCTFAVRHSKSCRIFVAGDGQDRAALFYSEFNDPTFFKGTSKVYPTTGDGPITGLAVFGDAVLVFFANSVWIWRGIDPAEDALWEKIPTGQGTVADESIALTQNSLTFLGQGGIYAISPALLSYGVTLAPGEDLIANLAANRVTSVIRGITLPAKVRGIYDAYNERYLLAYCDDAMISRNNKVLVYDWSLRAFTRYTGLWVNDFCYRQDGTVLAGTDGYILKLNTGHRDGSDQGIAMKIVSKAYNLGMPFHKKRMTRLFTSFRQTETGDPCRIDARIKVDDVTLLELADATVYDSFEWGDTWGETWGWRNLITTRMRISGSGHRVQVELSNKQLNIPATIYGWAFEFRPIRAKGERV